MVVGVLPVVVLSGGFALAFLITLLYNAVKVKIATERFKRQSNGLPLVKEGFSLFAGGHIFYLLFSRHLPEKLYKIQEQYGKTVGWMYGETYGVLTIDLDLIKKVVLDEPDKNVNRIRINLPIKELDENCIMEAKDDQWRRIRKVYAPALTKQKFKSPNVVREIENSIQKLIAGIEKRLDFALDLEKEKKPLADVNMENLMHRYSLDIVYSCFYKQYNLINFGLGKDHHTELIDSGLEAVIYDPLVRYGTVYSFIRPLLDWLIMNFHPQGKWRKEVMGFIQAQTKQNFEAKKKLAQLRALAREKSTNNEKVDEDNILLDDGTKFNRNLMDYITDKFHEGKLMKTEYFHTTFFLLNAADKTAADALATIFYYLSVDNEIQEKTRKAVLAEGVESEYLGWIVNEALRLCPPAPIGCSRLTSCDTEVTKGGYVVPKDTFVVTPLYTIHRWPEYWGNDAEEFKPERWSKAKSFHPCQFMPFGAGIRACPGKEFALFQMKMVICALLARYKFVSQKKLCSFNSPLLIYLLNDEPTYIQIARL